MRCPGTALKGAALKNPERDSVTFASQAGVTARDRRAATRRRSLAFRNIRTKKRRMGDARNTSPKRDS